MADLTGAEKRKLETLFDMSGGYVLNFSNRTLIEFVEEHTGRSLDDPKYAQQGTGSKAWRLRMFWKLEPNHLVGKLVSALIEYRVEQLERQQQDINFFEGLARLPNEEKLVSECRRIAARLASGSAIPDSDALTPPADGREFEILVEQVQEAIRKNQPEAGLDRLHTFVVKFVRTMCDARGVEYTKDRPLHAVFGSYVKALRSDGHLESEMTERILKSSISTLESFNGVRNEQSLAHDNAILNHDEARLIFSHVASTIRFLSALEQRIKRGARSDRLSTGPSDDEIPF